MKNKKTLALIALTGSLFIGINNCSHKQPETNNPRYDPQEEKEDLSKYKNAIVDLDYKIEDIKKIR